MQKLTKKRSIQQLPWKLLPVKTILIGLALMLLAGLFGEILGNRKAFFNSEKRGSILLDMDHAQIKGGKLTDGHLVSDGGKFTITFAFPRQYVHKLYYTYTSPLLNVQGEAAVTADSGYGQETLKKFPEKNSLIRTSSVIRVNETTGEIQLRFQGPTDGFRITSIGISDAPSFSKIRFAYFALGALLLYLLFICKKAIAQYPERLFLLIALPVGLLLILGLSPRESGWDESIHFYRAYSLLYDLRGKDTMPVSDHQFVYMDVGAANEPFYFPRSQEENAQERAYADELSEEVVTMQPTNGLHLYSVAYLPQTLFLAVGLALHLPFWLLMALGRTGNLLCYCLLTYFALRHMKQGKNILLMVALFPTSLFLASTFSYDAFINGCFFLGISYLLGELLETGRPLSYRNLGIFAAAIIIGSMPKAVYIPLLLLGLLIPADRFRNKKEAWIYRGILLFFVLLLLSTFVLPAAASTDTHSDPRGGDTSTARQLALILAHPISYARLALRSIVDTLYPYLLGPNVAGNLAYRGYLHFGDWLCPFIVSVVLMDSCQAGARRLDKWQKAFTVLLLCAIVGLIWTALYLSFTPVGLMQINGVQARYYLPLLVPFYLLFSGGRPGGRIPESRLNRMVLGGSLFFLFDGLWTSMVSMCL